MDKVSAEMSGNTHLKSMQGFSKAISVYSYDDMAFIFLILSKKQAPRETSPL